MLSLPHIPSGKYRNTPGLLPAILTVIILLQSCAGEQPAIISGQGYFEPRVSLDPSLSLMTDGSSVLLDESVIPTPEMLSLKISEVDGSRTHTWNAVTDFDKSQSYLSGYYNFNVSTSPQYISQGYASMSADTMVNLTGGETLPVMLKCLTNDAMVRLSGDGNTSGTNLSVARITIHTDGGGYHAANISDTPLSSDVLVPSGRLSLITSIKNERGDTARIISDTYTMLPVRQVAVVDVKANDECLCVTINGNTHRTPLDQSIFENSGPKATTGGFSNGRTITATEGIPLSSPVTVGYSSQRPLSHVILSINSPVYSKDINRDFELLGNNADYALLAEYGLLVNSSDGQKNVNIDLTKLIENGSTIAQASSEISLLAIDDMGLCSDPVSLTINTSAVNFELQSASTAMIGPDHAELTLKASSPDIERADIAIMAKNRIGQWVECTVDEWDLDSEQSTIHIGFKVPPGVDQVPVRVEYMGTTRLETSVQRSNPPLQISADVYATTAYIYFHSNVPEAVDAATRLATFTAGGNRITIWERYPERGLVVLSLLTPGTTYALQTVFGSNAPAAEASITTEEAEQIPSPDFEDAKQIIRYERLPSGGRYSTTNLQIVNRQNYADILVMWPKKHWASVNAKTFCRNAANHNTWYMMPSAEIVNDAKSGSKAIRITSTGWDLDGAGIPDYIQQPGQQLPYNANTPHVAHRSTGRLFLGSYIFDPTTMSEQYIEGVDFKSRPSSLNGFYKYTPDATVSSDRGLVQLEILGRDSTGNEITIGTGTGMFRFAPDYTVFSVPIEYKITGIKATRLKIMFSSSVTAGDIDREDSSVPVTAYPERGAMIGSSLTIDNLSFSY